MIRELSDVGPAHRRNCEAHHGQRGARQHERDCRGQAESPRRVAPESGREDERKSRDERNEVLGDEVVLSDQSSGQRQTGRNSGCQPDEPRRSPLVRGRTSQQEENRSHDRAADRDREDAARGEDEMREGALEGRTEREGLDGHADPLEQAARSDPVRVVSGGLVSHEREEDDARGSDCCNRPRDQAAWNPEDDERHRLAQPRKECEVVRRERGDRHRRP